MVRANTFLDFFAVSTKRSPGLPVLDVHTVSHAEDGMVPLRTPALRLASLALVRLAFDQKARAKLVVWLRLAGSRHHYLLLLLTCVAGKVKVMRLPGQ